MGLREALQALAKFIDAEYDRRIRTASLVKEYDPTGASHHRQIAVHNESIEQIDGSDGAHGQLSEGTAPTPEQQAAPRQVTHH